MPATPTSPASQPLDQKRLLPHPFVKETLAASFSESDDGNRTLNQYSVKHVIGKGAFGTVSLAVDDNGTEWALKEFSKSRLRKKQHANIFRGPRGRARPGAATFLKDLEAENPWYLIRGEIAILKKLAHQNVVSLHEVLDDPSQDSLWMVFEMCHKGVSMSVDLDHDVTPYSEGDARNLFRQLLLGIEYLHDNDICHRDIKPDNLLLTNDNVLKIVDFGVSEMFESGSDITNKTNGSPAFMAPELCTAQPGDVSGRAADLWSMGVTLYSFCFGRLPFLGRSLLDVYSAVLTTPLHIPVTASPELCDLLTRLLEKDPKKRMTMADLRVHPWVDSNGKEPLPSKEDNCERIVEQVTEEDIKEAVRTIHSIFMVLKAVKKLKKNSNGSARTLSNCSAKSNRSDDCPMAGTVLETTATMTAEPEPIRNSPDGNETGDPDVAKSGHFSASEGLFLRSTEELSNVPSCGGEQVILSGFGKGDGEDLRSPVDCYIRAAAAWENGGRSNLIGPNPPERHARCSLREDETNCSKPT